MEISLKGRCAIITGASKGLGLATAKRLAADGGDVAIVARTPETIEQAVREIKVEAKGAVLGVAADVSLAGDVQRAYDETMAAFGKIDIVINNAGQARAAPIEQLTDDLLQIDLDQKVFAALRLTRLVWPQMKERRWGRVINVLNSAAKAPQGGSAPTSVTRAAGMALMKVWSHEGGPHNILVNAMMVGLISSDQHARNAARQGVTLDALAEKMGKQVPLGRIGRAEEFANLAAFLVSDAGSYVSGAAINIDGGLNAVV